MISVFGAPISEADAKIIVEYLAVAYGPAEAKTTKKENTGKSHAKVP
jgi:hypothetical protein